MNKKKITLIAYKDVVKQIVKGEKTKEYREYKDFYRKRLKSLNTPFILRLRGGYNKDPIFVDVEIDNISIERPFINKFLAKLGIGQKYFVLNITRILDTNIKSKN